MSEKLKPCPFCGSENLSCEGHFVICNDCGARSDLTYPIPDDKKCLKNWNTRTADKETTYLEKLISNLQRMLFDRNELIDKLKSKLPSKEPIFLKDDVRGG